MRWAIGWRFQGVVLLVLVVACIKVSGGEARKLASCRLQVGAPIQLGAPSPCRGQLGAPISPLLPFPFPARRLQVGAPMPLPGTVLD